MWNTYYCYHRRMADNFNEPSFYWIWIDGRKGIQRYIWGGFFRIYMKHRVIMPPINMEPNPDNLYFKSIICVIRPYDLGGYGDLTFRYDDPRFDVKWAYLPAMRRIRRLSAGSWMDSCLGTDWTNDDLQVFDPRIEWYKDFKFLGKKTLLMPAESNPKGYLDEVWAKDPVKGAPICDFKNPPYWNSVGQWYQPTEVYITECIPPDEHPYSRRIHYVDAENFVPYFGELYDNRGEYWKWQEMDVIRRKECYKGRMTYKPDLMWQRDVQNLHATCAQINPHYKGDFNKDNDPDFTLDFFQTSTLLKMAR